MHIHHLYISTNYLIHQRQSYTRDVVGDDTTAEAKVGSISALDKLIFSLELDYRHDGAENLLACNGHIVLIAA